MRCARSVRLSSAMPMGMSAGKIGYRRQVKKTMMLHSSSLPLSLSHPCNICIFRPRDASFLLLDKIRSPKEQVAHHALSVRFQSFHVADTKKEPREDVFAWENENLGVADEKECGVVACVLSACVFLLFLFLCP